MGLSERADCYTGHLSGGERKRLSIALELVDDPSIIFLDECTTGLDSSSSVQIIQLLKKLAVDRTIVCTIHTPSKLILETFDLIYALSKGQCIYQGSTENIIPFLIEANIPCPDNYNPSEFLIEISNGDYGDHLNLELVVKIENGLNESYRNNMIEDGIITESKGSKLMLLDCNYSTHGRPSFLTQIQQLLMRNFLMTRRDKTLTTIRLFIHIAIATMISFICSNLGNDESQVYNIYKFLFFNIFITMFAAFSSLQTSCKYSNLCQFISIIKNSYFLLFCHLVPVDLPIIKREHFNGWYSVASYYLALTLIDIPIVFTTTFFYTLIVYFFTSQPLELFRFVSYVLVIFIQALTAQGLGLIAGSVLNVKYTLIFGSFLLFPFVLFSNFFILVRDTHPFWHWIFNTSFIKHAFEASMQVIFGYDRQKLECHTIYCHFKSSNDILKFFDIKTDFTSCIKNIIILGLCFRFIAFIMIWIRLRIKC